MAASDMIEKFQNDIFLEQAADIAGIGHWIYSETKGCYLFISKQYAKIHGISAEEFLSSRQTEQDDLDDVHPDDRKLVMEIYEKCREDGERYSIEYRFFHPDGQFRWIQEMGAGLEHEDGSWITTIGTIQDITERKKRDQELRENEQRLRTIFSSTQVGIGRTRLSDGKVLEANDKLARMFGYDDTTVFIEKAVLSDHYVDKADREQLIETYKREINQVFECDFKTLEGKILTIRSHGHLNVEEGYIDIIFTDTTEQTLATRALHESEQRFKDFAEAASDWYWEMGPDLRFTYFSERIDKEIGIEQAGLIGKTRKEIGKPEIVDEKWREHLEILNTHSPFRDFEYGVKRQNGTMAFVRVSGMPVFSDDGNFLGYRGTGTNITERMEAELAALVANRAKSDLMANMSHELRTPLNAILGFTGVMKDETFGPMGNEKYTQYLDDIHHSGEHLLDLINDILDVSAIEAGAMELQEEEVGFFDVIDASVRIIRPRAEVGRVSINLPVNPENWRILADERRIKQIFLNLLSNAVKFTPEGGEVSVTIWINDDGSVSAAISDTGIGMDDEDINKAMSMFGQVDSGLNRMHEGSGLGLPLTKGLVDLHDGTMDIKSKKDHGTIITLTLPKERVVGE